MQTAQTVVLGVRLSEDEQAAIRVIAHRHNLTVGALVAEAVSAMYPEEFKQEQALFFKYSVRKNGRKSNKAEGARNDTN